MHKYIIAASLSWHIWQGRNNIIFDQKPSNLEHLIHRTGANTIQWTRLSLGATHQMACELLGDFDHQHETSTLERMEMMDPPMQIFGRGIWTKSYFRYLWVRSGGLVLYVFSFDEQCSAPHTRRGILRRAFWYF